MNITRDVVRDLLTVYAAGEASADTRALVEEALSRDPALRAEADAMTASLAPLPAAPAAAPTAEKAALEKARDLIKARTATLVMAVLFSALPLTFTFRGGHVTFVVFRDEPIIAAAWWAVAVVMWVSHLRIRRRMAVIGV